MSSEVRGDRRGSKKNGKTRRDETQARIDRIMKKEDAPYLNSTARVTERMITSILEFIAIFILLSIVTTYMETGTADFATLPDTISLYLQPGGVIFTALVAYLPIMILENIGVYFGLGTYPRMVFGIVKLAAIGIWFATVFGSIGDIDLIKMANLDGEALNGLVSLTVNVKPFLKILIMLLILCCIIPVAEFAGSRRKHNAALRHRREMKQSKKDGKRRGEEPESDPETEEDSEEGEEEDSSEDPEYEPEGASEEDPEEDSEVDAEKGSAGKDSEKAE